MKDGTPPLNYATPQRVGRPPMYSLVLGVLAAAFLIVFGALLAFAMISAIYMRLLQGDASVHFWWVAVFVPVATVFLFVGVITMLGTIAALRGIPPRGARWERWAAWLNRARLDNSTSFRIGGRQADDHDH